MFARNAPECCKCVVDDFLFFFIVVVVQQSIRPVKKSHVGICCGQTAYLAVYVLIACINNNCAFCLFIHSMYERVFRGWIDFRRIWTLKTAERLFVICSVQFLFLYTISDKWICSRKSFSLRETAATVHVLSTYLSYRDRKFHNFTSFNQ